MSNHEAPGSLGEDGVFLARHMRAVPPPVYDGQIMTRSLGHLSGWTCPGITQTDVARHLQQWRAVASVELLNGLSLLTHTDRAGCKSGRESFAAQLPVQTFTLGHVWTRSPSGGGIPKLVLCVGPVSAELQVHLHT